MTRNKSKIPWCLISDIHKKLKENKNKGLQLLPYFLFLIPST